MKITLYTSSQNLSFLATSDGATGTFGSIRQAQQREDSRGPEVARQGKNVRENKEVKQIDHGPYSLQEVQDNGYKENWII